MEFSSKKIVLVEYFGGAKTSHHESMETLVAHLLTSNGKDFLAIVRDKLIPQAEAIWLADELEQAELEQELYDEENTNDI